MKKKNEEVFVLDVSNRLLKEVPKDVLKYTNLKELNLANNQITVLPEFLKELKYLEKLNISHNKITILPDYLVNFKYCKELNISKNKITNFNLPNNYDTFSALEVLNISDNPFKEIPAWIWRLYGLKELDITKLRLSQFPEKLTGLKGLQKLYVAENNISFLPESISRLRGLEVLWLDFNALQSIPESLTSLVKLKILDVSNNKLKRIPETINRLFFLEYLNVSENEIVALPKNIGDLKRLEIFDFYDNKIEALPESFYKFYKHKIDIRFDDNPYCEETLKKLKKMFTDTETDVVSSEKNIKKEEINNDFKIQSKAKKTFKRELKNRYNNSENLRYVFLIIASLFVVFAIFFKSIFIEVAKKDTIKSKKNEVKEKKLALEEVIRNRIKEVFIYTNDTLNLEFSIKHRGEFIDQFFIVYHEKGIRKTKPYYKSNIYDIILSNRKDNFSQMQVYDSLVPNETIKKFMITVCFKSNLTQQENNVFNVLINEDDLKKGKVLDTLNTLLIPKKDKLKRNDYTLYFSPYNANISKEEFLKTITLFKNLYMKQSLEESSQLKTLPIK